MIMEENALGPLEVPRLNSTRRCSPRCTNNIFYKSGKTCFRWFHKQEIPRPIIGNTVECESHGLRFRL